MSTKIVILGKPGEPINGVNIRMEVDGVFVDGEINLLLTAKNGEVATATVSMILPEIEYREPNE
jgi:hypothetical protein